MVQNSPAINSRSWIVAFETRYDEARRKREALAASARKRRGKGNFDSHNWHHAQARDEKRLVQERMEHGFRLKWERHVGGRKRKPFVEKGFRSDDNAMFRLFISRIPKGGKARASDDKATLYVPYRSKMLTLDSAYIEANKLFLGMIRLDCDAIFKSAGACTEALQDLVDAGKVPHLPHIVVGDQLDDGTFANPHFIFMLPYESEVWNDMSDERCRKGPVRLFDAVSRGLAKGLLSIGVDPAAPRLTMRMKNPISPIWRSFTLNGEHFMTLRQYSRCVDVRTTHEELARHAAIVQSGMGLTPSNVLFNSLRTHAAKLLREWHFDADPRMQQSRDALADDLHVALSKFARESGNCEVEVSYVIGKVAGYMAAEFDHRKIGSRASKSNRHALMHLVDGVNSVEERQRIGAEHSAKVRKTKTMVKLVAACTEVLAAGEEPSAARLASISGVSRASAYRHLEVCKAICLQTLDGEEATMDAGHMPDIELSESTDTPEAKISLSGYVAVEDFEHEAPAAYTGLAPDELAEWMEMNDPLLQYSSA